MPISESSSFRTPLTRVATSSDVSRESSSAPSTPDTTSSALAELENEGTKRRVKVIDPNKGRCAIENNNETSDIEYMRYFPDVLMEDEPMMKNIEWWWNMSLSSLNLDTRDNVLPVTASMAKLFGHHFWLLLPPMATVEQYYEKTKRVNVVAGASATTIGNRKGFPVIERGVFEYDFIPLGDGLRTRAIFRQINFVNSPTETDYECHKYPFSTLPKIKTHLHPKFAILEAGRQVNELLSDALSRGGLASLLETHQNLSKTDPRLPLVADIARAWTAPHHRGAMQDKTYHDPDREDYDDLRSDVTTSRPTALMRRRRPVPDEGNDSSEGDEKVADNESNVTPPYRDGVGPTRNEQGLAGKGQPPHDNDSGSKKRKASSSLPLSKKAILKVGRIDHAARLKEWTADASRIATKKKRV